MGFDRLGSGGVGSLRLVSDPAPPESVPTPMGAARHSSGTQSFAVLRGAFRWTREGSFRQMYIHGLNRMGGLLSGTPMAL